LKDDASSSATSSTAGVSGAVNAGRTTKWERGAACAGSADCEFPPADSVVELMEGHASGWGGVGVAVDRPGSCRGGTN